MTDEYWKKRARELEHHQPAHITQDKSLEDMLNSIPGMPPAPRQPSSGQPPSSAQNNGGWGAEHDIGAALAQRIAQAGGHAPTTMMGMPNQQQPRQQAQIVFVREGVRAYRQLEAQAYGNSQPLARFVGPIHGVADRQFEFKGSVDAYIIEGNEPVDMANPDPSKIKRLVVIQAPFIGKLLVPESAVFGPGGPVRQVLKG